MHRNVMVFVLTVLLACSVNATAVELRADHPEEYVVVKGDTLWDISGLFLKKPWLWPEIWYVNPQVKNPHLIYPGDVLTLAFCDGKPCLRVTKGRSVKLSPSIRSSAHDGAIPPIPLDAIAPFLSRPRVVGADELDLAPYIVATQDEHLIAGSGNRIYVRNLSDDQIDRRFTVYRSGEVYRNPVSEDGTEGELLGYEALYIADAEMERFGDPATALLTTTEREVLIGDRLLPEEDPVNQEFIPHAPTEDVYGKIISVVDGVSQIGQYHIVVINLGEREGMEPGHVLAIHEAGRIVRDDIAPKLKAGLNDESNSLSRTLPAEMVELPEERIGELMIFRTFEKVSYALVMHIERPAHIFDAVKKP